MTIAVAHHDSPEGRSALTHAAREAVFQHTSLAVLHIIENSRTEVPMETLKADLREALDAAGFVNLDWELYTAVEDTSRAAALVELTESVGAELLVVGSRRRSPIGKFLLGSTVQRVVLDSPVPVLVVKAPAVVTSERTG